eukprot:jgi/Chlat1/7102/Chrsp57S06787
MAEVGGGGGAGDGDGEAGKAQREPGSTVRKLVQHLDAFRGASLFNLGKAKPVKKKGDVVPHVHSVLRIRAQRGLQQAKHS